MTNKLNDEFILDMGDIEDEELSPLLDNDSTDSVVEHHAEENQDISGKSEDANEKKSVNEDQELPKDINSVLHKLNSVLFLRLWQRCG